MSVSSACAWDVIDGLSDPQLDPTGIVVIVIDIGEIDDIDGPTGPHWGLLNSSQLVLDLNF